MLFLVGAVVVIVGLLAMAIMGAEVATWVFAFIFYANVPGIATRFYDIPQGFVALFWLLLIPALIKYILIQRAKIIIDLPLTLMVLLLAIMVATSFRAQDIQLSLILIIEYAFEGVILYFLIINVIRTSGVLKRVTWALLFSGALLASLTVYQSITQDYGNQFGGLAQKSKEMEDYDKVLRNAEASGRPWAGNRAGGPLEDPNRYGQNLLMLLPLGLFIYWQDRSSRQRIISGCAVLLILSGILLTYSRGTFVALIFLVGILASMGYIRFRQIAIGAPIIVALALVVSPGYVERIQTIRGAEGLVQESSMHQPDSVTRSRTTEMLAALKVFLDHPILGVGPDQYVPYYSLEYMEDPNIAFADMGSPRESHTLYFQFAAETGIFGISTFFAIVGVVMYRLLKVRRLVRTDHVDFATAFFLSMVAYLGTGVFLHLSYQRYYWFMLALAAAAARVLEREYQQESRKLGHQTANTTILT